MRVRISVFFSVLPGSLFILIYRNGQCWNFRFLALNQRTTFLSKIWPGTASVVETSSLTATSAFPALAF
jgi:hypothetical protein